MAIIGASKSKKIFQELINFLLNLFWSKKEKISYYQDSDQSEVKRTLIWFFIEYVFTSASNFVGDFNFTI